MAFVCTTGDKGVAEDNNPLISFAFSDFAKIIIPLQENSTDLHLSNTLPHLPPRKKKKPGIYFTHNAT